MLYPQRNQARSLLDLSGLWQFQLDPGAVGETAGWYRGLPAPRTIAVPGSWNEQFTDADDYMGRAWYVTQVVVPASWRDQEVFLRVGSANYAARAWVNGVLVGTHEGGHLPFAFAITEHVAWDGPTTIAIEVENELRPDRVPPGGGQPTGIAAMMQNNPPGRFDFFPYAGIHRPVSLYAVPAVHLDDLIVVTDRDGADGVVRVTARVAGDWTGQGTAALDTPDGPLTAGLTFTAGTAEATLRVPNARLWQPGDPNLYPLTVTLRDGERVHDTYTLPSGIRTVTVQGDRLLLNGEPIFLKGFGKHEDFQLSGRGLNLPVLVTDNELLKWVGANSYRTSHYPYAEEALDLADREGILIIAETPAVGLSFDDGEENIARRLAQALQQTEELIARDKNHPSVIMWSLANEPFANNMRFGAPPAPPDPNETGDPTGGNAFFTTLTGRARALDPSRPITLVLLQGGSPSSWQDLCDVVCINRYYGWYLLGGRLAEAKQALADELDALHADQGKPIIITEFGADTIAGQHNEPPAMFSEEYQVEVLRFHLDVAAERAFVAGLHVWNFADFRTSQAIMRVGGLNLKGVFTRERQPKLAAHFLRERWGG
ncbi:MAG: beta-glucuronidase [Thermomicrobiales bacterium]